jgi:flagellar basal body-associated protein FliL
MAENDEEKPEGEVSEEDAAKAKKKKLIIIGAAALLVVGGLGGFLAMSGGDDAAPTAESGEEQPAGAGDEAQEAGEQKSEGGDPGEASGDAKPKAEGDGHGGEAGEHGGEGSSDLSHLNFGETYKFKAFHLNLGNPLENHYIRLELAAEYKGGAAQKTEMGRRLPQLRDAIVGVVGNKSKEFLLSPDGKSQLRREILIRVNRYMTQPIENVFITDILIE